MARNKPRSRKRPKKGKKKKTAAKKGTKPAPKKKAKKKGTGRASAGPGGAGTPPVTAPPFGVTLDDAVDESAVLDTVDQRRDLAERRTRILIAHHLGDDVDPDSLDPDHVLGESGYGFSTLRLQALAGDLSRITKKLGGDSIPMTKTEKAKKLKDLLDLVRAAIK